MTKCTETLQNGIITEYDYQYDKDGNRSKYVKTVNGEWTECYTYEYNSANQLISRTNQRQWTDNVTYYSYDADGNLISEQTGHFEKTYEYTAENRLAVVKAQGTVLMAALYDGDGNRLFTMDYTGENNDRWDIWIPECGGNADQVDDSAKDAMRDLASLVSRKDRRDYTITEYVNDITRENEEVLAELNHRGKITTAYTYGYTRESADVYGDTQYFLYDGQGNVSRISSEWGRVKEIYVYDPYGNLTYGVPDTVNYYGYNGESLNLATGLQYLRARYYSPQTGSFITEDTYAGQVSNPLTLNRYDYVSNNPVNYIDPSGHFGVLDLWNDAKALASDAWNGAKNLVSNAVGTFIDLGERIADTLGGLFIDNESKPKPKENNKIAKPVVNLVDVISKDISEIVDSVPMPDSVQKQKEKAKQEAFREFCKSLIGGTVKGLTNAYDLLPENVQDNIKNAMDNLNVWGTNNINIFDELVTKNKVEQAVFKKYEDPISQLLAFEYNSKDDYYYTNENYGIQRYAGFHDAIDDFGGLLGMDLDTKIIEYKYNNVYYRLQFWKGSYGAGNAYGGEIGLYSNTDGNGWYATVEGEQEIRTKQWLIDKNTGDVLLYNDVAAYTVDKKHFWNLAIRTTPGYTKDNLIQESVLYIEDEGHRELLYGKLQEAGLQVNWKGEMGIHVIY